MTACLQPPDERSLTRAAAGGDRNSLAELLRRVEPKLLRYCRARIGAAQSTDAGAEDVAQEVMLAAMDALPRYRADGAGFEAYVFGIARRKVADFHRANRRTVPTSTEDLPETTDDRPGPAQSAVDSECRTMVRALLHRLPQKQQDILTMRVVLGMTAEETARVLDSTSGAVRVSQHRALEKLRALLGRPSTG